MSASFAKVLRTNASDAERKLWRRLRDRQIAGFKFRRQVPWGPYIADFVCFEARLIIEVDGGQHSENIEYDEKRTAWLNAQGFEVLRFWNNEVLGETDAVLEVIRCKLLERPPHPRSAGAQDMPALTPSPSMREATISSPSPSMGEGWGEGENKGFALISALAFLIVITLLGVSLFLGVNLQQRAAGNSLQKTRALQLANSVTVASERWLAAFTEAPPAFVRCRDDTASADVFRVCVAAPVNPALPKGWMNAGATTVSVANLETSQSGGTDTYYAAPGVWISYLGHATMGPGDLYRIVTYAWGGNVKSLVVTETVFYVGGDTHRTTSAQNLGQ